MNAESESELDPRQHYAELLQRRPSVGHVEEPVWLSELRDQANKQIQTNGFPDRRHEAWRYTSLDALLKTPFVQGEAMDALLPSDIDELLIPGLEAWRLVLVNGHFAPALSSITGLPAGVTAAGLAESLAGDVEKLDLAWLSAQLTGDAGAAAESESVFQAINLAGMQDGAVVNIGAGVRLDKPLEILHLSIGADDPGVALPRNLVVLESGAQALLVERYAALGESLYFTNSVTDVHLAENASLQHFRLQEESSKAYHLHSLNLRQATRSHYRGTGLSLGGAWSRTDWNAGFDGEFGRCDLKGLYIVGDGQFMDNHLDVRHEQPNCTSTEDFRGVLNGRGRGVFDGRILVARDAQKTDAQLSNRNLMLSRQAEVDTKPQLEIYADDVACSHGTTIGQVEPDNLFYLRSRGIPEHRAMAMICMGFANSLLGDCRDAALARYLEHSVSRRFESEAGQDV